MHCDESGPFVPSSIEIQPAPAVRHDRGDRERAHAVRPSLEHRLVAVVIGLETTHPGPDRDAYPLALVRDLDAGIGLRLSRSRHDHLRKPVQPPDLLRLEPRARVEVFQLAREAHRGTTRRRTT